VDISGHWHSLGGVDLVHDIQKKWTINPTMFDSCLTGNGRSYCPGPCEVHRPCMNDHSTNRNHSSLSESAEIVLKRIMKGFTNQYELNE
jgi:hypothetical protein